MKENIVIGKITGAHGIKGEISVYPITDDINRFYDLSYILIDDREYEVTEVRIHKGRALISLADVTDRNTAEHLRGNMVSVRREDAVKLNEGEYFIEDLKGLKINDTSNRVSSGVINDILQTGAVDIIEIKTPNGILMLPYLNKYVSDVDLQNGIMTLDLSEAVEA